MRDELIMGFLQELAYCKLCGKCPMVFRYLTLSIFYFKELLIVDLRCNKFGIYYYGINKTSQNGTSVFQKDNSLARM